MAPLTLSPSDYRRLATVLRTLTRTGARPVLVRLGLLRGAAPDEVAEGAAYEGLVAALEELGPTFVKLGQILATRSDLLPPELTDRLSRLHAAVSPAPFEWVREQLAIDLGGSPDESSRNSRRRRSLRPRLRRSMPHGKGPVKRSS